MKTTTQLTTPASLSETTDSRGAKAWAGRLGHLSRTLQLRLVASRSGRIVLHLLVALQTCHFLWHWQGIVREFARP